MHVSRILLILVDSFQALPKALFHFLTQLPKPIPTQHIVLNRTSKTTMSLDDRLEHFLPASINEFDSVFVRELYRRLTGKRTDSSQVEQAILRVCTNKTGRRVNQNDLLNRALSTYQT